MSSDTHTKIQIYSRRMSQAYEVRSFVEYSVDIDLETDADQFHMVFGNPGGKYTGLFSKFDPILIYINGQPVFKGTIDNIEYTWDENNGSVVQMVGRDIMSALVDNDALPTTLNNVNPCQYIKSKCAEYGITNTILDGDSPVQEKVIIGTNESEISIMSNLVVDDNRRIWSIFDTVYMGKWNTNAKPSYKFTHGVPVDEAGIPIKSLNLSDNGTTLRSEVKIYGSTDDGNNKVEGTATNPALTELGIKKRRTMRSSNNDSTSKYASTALEHVRDDFRSGIELKIDVKTLDTKEKVILPGLTAHVVDYTTRLNSTFFIRAVNFKKNSAGSVTSVTMIPDDSTFKVLWTITGTKAGKTTKSSKDFSNIVGTPDVTVIELIRNQK